jgi:hypothetical protein
VLVILLPTVDRDLQIKLFRAATRDDRKPIDQVLEEQPAWHNLILGRPSESIVQDHLNFGWVTTIRVEAELAEGIAPPLRCTAGARPLADLGDSDQCGISLHPSPDASAGHGYRRRPRSHLAGYRSKAVKTALSPFN